jgi:Chaperone of endosialidase
MKTMIAEVLPCFNANRRNSMNHAPWAHDSFLILLLIACFGLMPQVQAVVPPPDGGYPGFNTAEGQNALFSLTTGVGNTANGWYSLWSNTDGSYNTTLGAGTLLFNVGNQSTGEGTENTAVGTAALLSNTNGFRNTATGFRALFSNMIGDGNTAVGADALFSNNAFHNTALGDGALQNNTTGSNNTAAGHSALQNYSGSAGNNTAVGGGALFSIQTGGSNTAVGFATLSSLQTNSFNTAIGSLALNSNTTGALNTAVGRSAGGDITGSGNVCIGANVVGAAGVSDTTWIANVYDSVAIARQVYVNADNKIGTLSSSRRYKEQIEPMDEASEALFTLKPVTFRYKKAVDPSQALSFGLIAEEVAEVNPALITRDKQGKPQTVRYEAVNAMLLNEFLKEHRAFVEQRHEVEKLKATVGDLLATVKEQAAQIQKVSTQLDLNSPAARTVAIDQ